MPEYRPRQDKTHWSRRRWRKLRHWLRWLLLALLIVAATALLLIISNSLRK